jgi:type IV secretion system protein VirD4
MLGQQAALGTPWISLGSVAVYAPWKLFAWWMVFDARAPQVFRRAGLLVSDRNAGFKSVT